eukprot:5008153-Pleurochrysis_carterae.AAC.1
MTAIGVARASELGSSETEEVRLDDGEATWSPIAAACVGGARAPSAGCSAGPSMASAARRAAATALSASLQTSLRASTSLATCTAAVCPACAAAAERSPQLLSWLPSSTFASARDSRIAHASCSSSSI